MKRPSHATIVAYLALFTALSGTAYAAATIGSREIKNNSIHSRDVRNQTLSSRDINERSLRTSPRLYTKSVTTVFPALGNRTVATVLCDRGDLAVSGTSFLGGRNVEVSSEGLPAGKLVGWTAIFEKTGPNATPGSADPQPAVTVVCARRAPR